MTPMTEVFLCDAVRTPIGRFRGALRDVRADDLAALPLVALVARNRLPPEAIDELFLGCANQAGEDNRNVARMAALLAGLPDTVPAVTVNRLCGSGLEAVIQGMRAIRTGDADITICGGVESMTRAPHVLPKSADGFPSGKLELYDTSLGWRFPNPRLAARFPLEAMGETAENVAARFAIGRQAQDAYALASHQKALSAQAAGAFERERIPVEIAQKKGETLRVEHDEGPRADSSLEKLARLPAAFREGGTVTAGNASTLNDGSAAVLLASGAGARKHGLTPRLRLVASGIAGLDPRFMGLGPVPATRQALARAGWSVGDLDAVELNEAFAAQALACIGELGLDPLRVNVHGGAIALGHPLGASGARILATLEGVLTARGGRRGLATLCIGVGQGIALLVERV
jgi:3-oxoadipyl-CoA thiolase